MNQEHTSTLTSPSLEVLCNAYDVGASRRIYHLINHREGARDLTQEVFVRALPQLQATRNLYGWLYRIATNPALDVLRRRKLISWQSRDATESILEAAETCDPQTRYNGTMELVSLALVDLSEHYCSVLLPGEEGYSHAEIVQAQGRTPHVLESGLARARESFQKHYQTLEQQEEVKA
jgi:RNA polymerase sigma-70 factor (ECF subfamily)